MMSDKFDDRKRSNVVPSGIQKQPKVEVAEGLFPPGWLYVPEPVEELPPEVVADLPAEARARYEEALRKSRHMNVNDVREHVYAKMEAEGLPVDRGWLDFMWGLEEQAAAMGYYEEEEREGRAMTKEDLLELIESYEESTGQARVEDNVAGGIIDGWRAFNPKLFMALREMGMLWRAAHALRAYQDKLVAKWVADHVPEEVARYETDYIVRIHEDAETATLPYDLDPDGWNSEWEEEFGGYTPAEGYMEADPSFLPAAEDDEEEDDD